MQKYYLCFCGVHFFKLFNTNQSSTDKLSQTGKYNSFNKLDYCESTLAHLTVLLLGFPPPGAMPLGHPPSSKGGVEELPLDPAGLGNRKNDEVPEGRNIFNNEIEPMSESVFLF